MEEGKGEVESKNIRIMSKISKKLLVDTYNEAFTILDDGMIDKEIIYDFLDTLSEVELLELSMRANEKRLVAEFKKFLKK
jgi:hypothetical protein